ncbi:MAG: hypothetical protein RBS80_15030 [Thermoguttaceae bacterium]|jgi:ABC-type transport system involved in multi-copper enzyme maturation permease subunit|nr:hypothetical protein [Thermoguttaceae bacterium]
MVIEDEILPFFQWLPTGLLHWLLIAGSLAVAALLIGWLIAALRHGPGAAVRMVSKTLSEAWADVIHMSGRRIWALAWLAVKESIRRWVVVVFGVFIVILLFAGFFLDPASTYPARLYLSFVLTSTMYLILLLALFLSTLSLPADIKSKTLHTVVTKPVRASEIVLGRMIGFALVGTGLLACMGVLSYIFVLRGLSHTHEISPGELQRLQASWEQQLAGGKSAPPVEIETETAHGHRHTFRADAIRRDGDRRELIPRGRVRTDVARGHWHEFSYTVPDGALRSDDPLALQYTMGPPEDRFVARVPIYGKLRFKDSSGEPVEAGVNVGSEWAYRSFIQGGTLAAAIWTFEGITPQRFPEDRFPEGLPVELTIEVFRTYKGDTSGEDIPPIHGSLIVRNPASGEQVEVRIFPAREFATDTQIIPRKLTRASDGRTFGLFEDFVHDGKLEVWVRCIEPAQYFGMAQADMYLRARDGWFAWNFVKGYLGIWLQMLLMIAFGVMFSTFLSGPVAILATLGALIGGMASRFMISLATGELPGGGPVEAFYRLLTQENLVSDLPEGFRSELMRMFDTVLQGYLRGMAEILPAFERFDYSTWVAYGFNISGDLLATRILTMLGFVLPVFLAGYFFLKLREVAR